MTRGEPLSGIQLRPLGPGDDLEAELDLRRRAFGPVSAPQLPAWLTSMRTSIEAGATIGAFDGHRLVGSARYHLMQQWWHGRPMPMAGVGGVKVAPEERGRGIGTAMMARLLRDVADRGYPVSALYPATAPLYRSFGWEIAGGKYQTVVPVRSLAALIGPDESVAAVAGHGPAHAAPVLRRATPDEGAAVVAVKGLVHDRLRHCGPNTREPWELRDWLADPEHFAYLADDGFLSYRWARQADEIDVEELIAASAATARALWQVLASHATMVTKIRACLAPDDPVHVLSREPDAELHRTEAWMLRVVDAAAAVAARGYPASVSVSVPIDLADPVLPVNAGRWRLEVADGKGSLQRADGGTAAAALRLGARGFAALFAGSAVGTLRLAGLADGGDPAADDALEAAFRGHAFMIDEW
ncbi:MAG TPA: GNAT family N-acetyltransferase [Streptosporangiaceae bacterium]|nr:GNAT family N-acetyltransferase [Streptosporangiaceae bacterium]